MKENILSAVTREEVLALMQGKISVKSFDALKFETQDMPLQGTILGLVEEPQEYETPKGDKVLYFVFAVGNSEGKKIGVMAVNRLFDTYVREGDLLQIGERSKSEHKGEFMLRSHKVNDLSRFGTSRAEQIANVIGKNYVAKREDKSVLVEYTEDKLFVSTDNTTNRKNLWKNTAIKKLVEIKFEE